MGGRRSWLREATLVLLVLSLLLGGAAAYAQNWPPAVIVESSSMMHPDGAVGFGRVGTIDPGDLVLVKGVHDARDVETLVEMGPARYGEAGDVIVYLRGGGRDVTPIIHRAIAYVEVAPEGHRVRWAPEAPCTGGAAKDPADPSWCVYDPEGGVDLSDVPGAGERPFRPGRSGFLTKGDNPVTNPETDQALGIAHDERGRPSLVPVEWVEGKARGELPWLGLVKLSLAGRPNEANPPASYVRIGSAYAPPDLWVMLGVSVALLVGGPLAWDAVKARRRRS